MKEVEKFKYKEKIDIKIDEIAKTIEDRYELEGLERTHLGMGLVPLRVFYLMIQDINKSLVEVSKDNATIKKHVEYMNKGYQVLSSVGDKRDNKPNLIIIFEKQGQEVINMYHYEPEYAQELLDIVEGFAKHQHSADVPFAFSLRRLKY